MPRPDWFLILNGKSAGDDAVREAVQALRARGVALQVRVTWEGGDAERFVAEALERGAGHVIAGGGDRSEEHTSELQSLMRISYAVFCLKKKRHKTKYTDVCRMTDDLEWRVTTDETQTTT